MSRLPHPNRLLYTFLLVFLSLSGDSNASSYLVGSKSCPAVLRFPAVLIKELNVKWTPEPLALVDASLFEQPQSKSGWMGVVFNDLATVYEFPYY